eukprot:Phypoly_transcript_14126.p1 GENE.Phypoly_transcript_14126~~Phypoly_transcript_14126.p1  ORF type:complete len:192 (+),score=18.49 Phypoly_transcript_14126:359-934(+)
MTCVATYTPDRFERVFLSNYSLNYYYGALLSKALRWSSPRSTFNAHEVLPNVFVGDVYSAHNTREMKKLGFSHVVNVACGVAPAYPNDFTYLHIPLLDCASENIQEHFHKTSAFIESALAGGGRVLIHCLKGVSRSATIAAAFTIRALSATPEEAVRLLQQNRPIIKPNSGFMNQLEWYHRTLQTQAAERN